MSVRANFADVQGMRGRSMRSGTELTREIQPTDWSTTGEQGKLFLFISLFTAGKSRLSIVQIADQFNIFTFRFLSRKKKLERNSF